MPLRVLEPGLHTLVVDRGRPHSRRLGVPVGGAADRASFLLGNALVGNEPNAAALEISLAGPTLQADTELACVVFGAPFTVAAERHTGLAAGKTFTLLPGEVLRIGGTPRGMRAYLCVRGGIDVPTVLGSRSALAPLLAGAELACSPGRVGSRFIRHPFGDEGAEDVLRAVPGPQADWFAEEEFYGQTFTVTPASDRMGLRLQGRPLTLPASPREMVSEPVGPGAVQVTRDGQCIVLGVDGQTIGGYPKVAHIVSGDWDRLGQLRPGQAVHFRRVGLEVAEALFEMRQADLREWLTRLGVSIV